MFGQLPGSFSKARNFILYNKQMGAQPSLTRLHVGAWLQESLSLY